VSAVNRILIKDSTQKKYNKRGIGTEGKMDQFIFCGEKKLIKDLPSKIANKRLDMV